MAQALLPVPIFLDLLAAHSQEWLCHQTFSAACKAPNGRQSFHGGAEAPPFPSLPEITRTLVNQYQDSTH